MWKFRFSAIDNIHLYVNTKLCLDSKIKNEYTHNVIYGKARFGNIGGKN